MKRIKTILIIAATYPQAFSIKTGIGCMFLVMILGAIKLEKIYAAI